MFITRLTHCKQNSLHHGIILFLLLTSIVLLLILPILTILSRWIAEGLAEWYKAMRCALFLIAYQAQQSRPACRRLVESVQRLRLQMTGSTDLLPNDEFEFQCWSQFDGIIKSQVVDDLCSAFTHLGGQYIMFEMGDDEENQSRYIPIPDCLSYMPRGQALIGAINCGITCQAMDLLQDLGLGNVVVSEAVHAAMYNGLRAGGASLPTHIKVGTPKEAFSCCLDKFRAGLTFDDGLRRYISLLYRGTVVFSLIIRIHNMADKFCAYLRWAREFIELVDEHFHVRETGNYAEVGSCFRASFQINILWAEIDAYHFLMPNTRSAKIKMTSGAFPLVGFLQLLKKARDLIEIPFATNVGDYQEYSMATAFKRKPTARVFSLLAANMKDMASRMDQDDFRALLVDTGHIDADCSLSPDGIIASFYRRAAEAELPDDENASIYWLAYGANCCEADESDGYTLGNLREALRNATRAQQCRDVGIFGPDTDAGGSYGSLCKIVCEHYLTETNDSFILPQVCITDRGKSTTLELGNKIICRDFGRLIEEEQKRFADYQQEKDDTLFDEFEAEHGEAENQGVPSLTMLAVRSLHKAGYDYAKGERDPSSIILKAMQDQKS